MIEVLVKSALLLAFGGVLARKLAPRHPSASHLVWTTIFLGVMLMPVLAPWVGPRMPILMQVPGAAFEAMAPERPTKTSQPTPSSHPNDLASFSSAAALPSVETVLWTLWGIGALFVAFRYALGWRCVDAVRRRRSYLVEPGDLPLDHRALAAQAGISTNWELRQSAVPEVATAMTWGVLRPVVLVPHDADRWTPEKLEAILLHELAHVRRRDFAGQLLAEAVCALHWFNPLAWFGARAMREVAESAADDAVLRAGVKASDYAALLLQLAAEIAQRSRPLARIGVSVMSQPKIESRLKSVLSTSARKRGLTSVQALATVAFVGAAIAAMAAMKVEGSTRQDEAQEALHRVKMLAIATQIYANDYDENIPYALNSETAKAVIRPYVKDPNIFNSPTKGGKIEFNLNMGGVHFSEIKSPSEAPLWIERIPGNSAPAVSFVDTHAILADAEAKKKVEKDLKKSYPRNGHPLPKNFRPYGDLD